MKPYTRFLLGLGSLLLSLGLSAGAGAQPRDYPALQRAAGIAYLSGGIGDDELQTLAELGQSYDLKLIFADPTGHYLADVNVQISDERGHQLLAAVSDGPWFFVNLPAGRYHVLVSTQGATREQVIAVVPDYQVQRTFSLPEHPTTLGGEEARQTRTSR